MQVGCVLAPRLIPLNIVGECSGRNEGHLFPDTELGVRCTPTHWFPEDRSWLVTSSYDLTFSLIGGSEHLVQQLLGHPVLECVRVAPTTRVDRKADLESTSH